MRIFKNTIKRRLKSLEDFFGVFYDYEVNYPEHKEEKDSYGAINQLERRLKVLEKDYESRKESKK